MITCAAQGQYYAIRSREAPTRHVRVLRVVSMARAMHRHRVIRRAALREELRVRGSGRVEGFGWRQTAEQMPRLIDEVGSGRATGS